jgi:hypothetical protein
MKAQIITVLLFSLISCNNNSEKKEVVIKDAKNKINSVVYSGGDIITMSGNKLELAESVVTEADEIVFVGAKEDAFKDFPNAKKHDLHGETLMPGFIEPHIHPSLAATMLPNEIIAPYDWVLPNGTKKGVSGHDEYIKRITSSIKENSKPGEMYFIWGYHQ